MPIIAVGSTNPTKIGAVKIAFEKVFPNEKWDITGVAVSSGVSNQPMHDSESIQGATTRAKKALKELKADFGVGLEGGLHKIDDKWFETGWAVVINKDGKLGVGSSIRMETPKSFIDLIEQGHELGTATDIIFKRKNSKQQEGFFGIMTHGHIDRANGYADGIVAALARFLHKDLF